MNIWLAGDSLIRSAVKEFVTENSATLIDTSIEHCIPEHVWTEQIHDEVIRLRYRKLESLRGIFYLNVPDYDSENTVIQLLRRFPEKKRLLAFIYPYDKAVEEGFQHDGEGWIDICILTSLDHDHVLDFIQKWYNATNSMEG